MDNRDPLITDAERRGTDLLLGLAALGRSEHPFPGTTYLPTVERLNGCYEPARLSLLATSLSWSLWHYRDLDDRLSDVLSPGYFHGPACKMRAGDFIAINGFDGTTLAVAVQHGDELLATSITGTAR